MARTPGHGGGRLYSATDPETGTTTYNGDHYVTLRTDTKGQQTKHNVTPLRSGWTWGEHYLNGAVSAVQASVGKGNIYLFGPETTFRGQPYGTFKFLFNAIYRAGARPVTLQ